VSPPPQYPHVICKSKRFQMQEERYQEIDRANNQLLERMTGILSSSKSVASRVVSPNSTQSRIRSQKSVDSDDKPTTLPPIRKSLNDRVRR